MQESTSTALALPDSVAAAKRMIEDVIDVASIVVHGCDRETARNKMRKRLVMNGDSPLIAPVLFEGRVIRNRVGDPIDLKIGTTIRIPGLGEVEATPLISLGIAYLVKSEDDEAVRSAGTFHCLVFRPKGEGKPYKVLPLGLADSSMLEKWNTIAQQRGGTWPVIEPIENDLRKSGSRTFVFMPRCLEKKTFKNTEFRFVKGQCKEVDVDNDVWHIGFMFGQMLMLSPNSQVPPTDTVDGHECFVSNHVFRVKIGENSLELTWLGREGEVEVDDRVAVVDVSDSMDSFAVLGTSPKRIDIETIETSSHVWLYRAFDERNPLYRSALEMGIVQSGDSVDSVRSILENLRTQALKKAIHEMHEAYHETTGLLLRADKRPTIEEILGGRIMKALLHSVTKDDLAAKWIGTKIESEFDPCSPFHLALRHWLIMAIARAADYSDPKPVKLTEEPKATPAPTPEVSVEPAPASSKTTNGVEVVAKKKAPAKKKPTTKSKRSAPA